MPSQKIQAIIFDIGRVLVRVDVASAIENLARGISLSPQEIWTAIEKDPRWQDWQEGRISPRDWHLHLSKRLGGTLSFEQFTEAWNRALDPQPLRISSQKLPSRASFEHRSHSRCPPRSHFRLFSILPKIRPHLFLRRWLEQAVSLGISRRPQVPARQRRECSLY